MGGEVHHSTATDNGQFGFATGGIPDNGGATIAHSSAYRNGGEGIYDWGRSLIDSCVINGNEVGIRQGNGGSLIRNTIITNHSGSAMQLGMTSNFEAGGAPTALVGNSITGNNGGSANAQFGGPFVELGPNQCGLDTACP